MATEKPRFSITLDDELYEKVNEYQHLKKFPTQTKAVVDLLRRGAGALGLVAGEDIDPDSEDWLPGELERAKKYRALDRHGKELVDIILDRESARVTEELRRARRKELFLDAGSDEPSDRRVIPLYLTPAAAGYTSPVFGEDFEYLEVGDAVPRQADFAVRIDGDSMEPYIMDGATVYVNRDPLADGDVGIFCLDGDMLCKQYHKDARGAVRLLSLNRRRADADRVVSEGSALACFGRVILPHAPALALQSAWFYVT